MEYIDGTNLSQLVQQDDLTINDVLNIGIGICNGLKAAHAKNILHRDIKPQNILLTAEKEAKIADFSIATNIGGIYRICWNYDRHKTIHGTGTTVRCL